jgi:hypothetical protein
MTNGPYIFPGRHGKGHRKAPGRAIIAAMNRVGINSPENLKRWKC